MKWKQKTKAVKWNFPQPLPTYVHKIHAQVHESRLTFPNQVILLMFPTLQICSKKTLFWNWYFRLMIWNLYLIQIFPAGDCLGAIIIHSLFLEQTDLESVGTLNLLKISATTREPRTEASRCCYATKIQFPISRNKVPHKYFTLRGGDRSIKNPHLP